ncbi:Hypothetical_protein [Hexamita inflata]|uniref:Hypothetical_protein n=1 Tax=Hexamita inflata TaxID=28002 RepID=A0AA86UL16_9EUKA|nr:Hypothetical protein HINF_LOCUS31233 [Hexamita inflata]
MEHINWIYALAKKIETYSQSPEYLSQTKPADFTQFCCSVLNLCWPFGQCHKIVFKNGLPQIQQPNNKVKAKKVYPGFIFAISMNEKGEFVKLDIAGAQEYNVLVDIFTLKDVCKNAMGVYDEAQAIQEYLRVKHNIGKRYQIGECSTVYSYQDAVLVPLLLLKDQKQIWEENSYILSKCKEKYQGLEIIKQSQNEYVVLQMFADMKKCLVELSKQSLMHQILFQKQVEQYLDRPDFNLDSLLELPHIQILERISRIHQQIIVFNTNKQKAFNFNKIITNKHSKLYLLSEKMQQIKPGIEEKLLVLNKLSQELNSKYELNKESIQHNIKMAQEALKQKVNSIRSKNVTKTRVVIKKQNPSKIFQSCDNESTKKIKYAPKSRCNESKCILQQPQKLSNLSKQLFNSSFQRK